MSGKAGVDRLANDPVFVLISRIIVLVVCGLVAWTGTRLINTLDKTVAETNKLARQVAVNDFRINANDKRLDRIETTQPRTEYFPPEDNGQERKYP